MTPYQEDKQSNLKNGQRTCIGTSLRRTYRGPRDIDMNDCSISLAIRQMQIKTTMRYHFTLVRLVIIKKSVNKSDGEDVEKRGP